LPGELYKTYHYTKLFLFEDVYVAMLSQKLHTNIVSLRPRKSYCASDATCFYALHRNIKKTYFFMNSFSPAKMLNGWLEIQEKMMDVLSGKVEQEPKFL